MPPRQLARSVALAVLCVCAISTIPAAFGRALSAVDAAVQPAAVGQGLRTLGYPFVALLNADKSLSCGGVLIKNDVRALGSSSAAGILGWRRAAGGGRQ